MADFIGTLQTDSLKKTLSAVKNALLYGRDVRVSIVDFGEKSREHSQVEFEVYVNYDDIDQKDIQGRYRAVVELSEEERTPIDKALTLLDGIRQANIDRSVAIDTLVNECESQLVSLKEEEVA